MTIDRLLIICSLIELSFIACHDGIDCFTSFQWLAILLLCIKGMLAVVVYRRKALPPQPVDINAAFSVVAADSDHQE